MRRLQTWTGALAIGAVLVICASPAAAADEEPAEGQQAGPATEAEGGTTLADAVMIVGACLGSAAAVIGGGLAIAKIGGRCMESMARQPEAAGSMFGPMFVAAAMVEGAMLFAILVCLLTVLVR
mgnify:CR=1 FL=1